MEIVHINNNFRWDCCPLCKSNNIYRGGTLQYKGRIKFSTCEIDLACLPELWRCRQCQSGFVQNIIDAATAASLYSTGHAGDRWTSESFAEVKTADVVACMQSILQSRGHVLDVGCNTGELLDFASSLGCQTSGVEFSLASREIIKAHGHTAYESFEEALQEYNVITAFDVVEHMYDVPGFLRDCRKKLEKNGKLVLLTGDIQSMSAKLAGKYWWYAQFPEHIVFPAKKYFVEYSSFQVAEWMPTYAAAKGYKHPVAKMIYGAANGLASGRYTGLPSLGHDHTLIVLKK